MPLSLRIMGHNDGVREALHLAHHQPEAAEALPRVQQRGHEETAPVAQAEQAVDRVMADVADVDVGQAIEHGISV